jgi:hypothetical protein
MFVLSWFEIYLFIYLFSQVKNIKLQFSCIRFYRPLLPMCIWHYAMSRVKNLTAKNIRFYLLKRGRLSFTHRNNVQILS